MKNFLKRKKELAHEKDLEDRKVYLLEVIFQTVLGETIKYYEWTRLQNYSHGELSYRKEELSLRVITVEKTTYQTSHIVSMTSKILAERTVKEEVKRKMGGYKSSNHSQWMYQNEFETEEIENIVSVKEEGENATDNNTEDTEE